MEFYVREDYIFTSQGDRFALYNEGQASPLAYRLSPDQRSTSWAISASAAYAPGDQVDFDEGIPMPYEFSLEIYYDTGKIYHFRSPLQSIHDSILFLCRYNDI